MAIVRSIYEYNLTDPVCNITYFVPIQEGGCIGGIEAKILFQKQLKSGDMRKTLSIIPAIESGTLKMDVLKEEERRKLKREGFLMLLTKDPDGAFYNLRFRYNAATGEARISEDWFEILMENNLKEGVYVTGWGYRKPEHLRIALTFNKTARFA